VARKSKNKPAPAAVEVSHAPKRGRPRRARNAGSPAADRAGAHAEDDILEAEAHLIAEEDLPAPPSVGALDLHPDASLDHSEDDVHLGDHDTVADGSNLPAHPLVPLPGFHDTDAQHSALVPLDPFSAYLADIRRFPLLTREEELDLARRYKTAKDPEAAKEAAYKLVTGNLRLVVKIAREFSRATRNLLDLVQEGNIGLMEAVRNFDPYRGIRFPSYAVWWVRAYIYRYLMANWRMVKIGTTQAQRKLFFNLKKETERLEADGFKPQPKLIAQRMGVKESEVREMQERMAQSEVSLDQPSVNGGESNLLDVLPDDSRNPEEAAGDAEWRAFAHDQIQQFENTLKDKELEIFRARLLTENPETLQVIGERFGISRERVRQIETRLKRRLKDFITANSDLGSTQS
jgi:RNA polymerase sigma-32 factor